jgi:hypothetical protein
VVEDLTRNREIAGLNPAAETGREKILKMMQKYILISNGGRQIAKTD